MAMCFMNTRLVLVISGAWQSTRLLIADWVRLCGSAIVHRRGCGILVNYRAHDAQLITHVEKILADDQVDRGAIHILAPREATNFTLKTITAGKDCISITGNAVGLFD